MRVLITGVDGYLGWALALHLARAGHQVAGIDNYSRRRWVRESHSDSAIPIVAMPERLAAFYRFTGKELDFFEGDLTDFPFTLETYTRFKPEAIVYLGEMPSAAYSMIDVHHAVYTQTNNVMGTLVTLHAMQAVVPDCHLVKLGTMGEYGTPNLDIPEGFFEIEYRGRRDRLMFPRKAGSWYHQSKVHDTHNVEMACRLWGLRSTDIMQGVVYGTRTEELTAAPELRTRFDFDQSFGTVINRYCAQAVIGEPLTPYGKGSQKRSFLPIVDSIRCLQLTVETPPEKGAYRVFNQFENVYSINELADIIQRVGNRMGLNVAIRHLENPRIEAEEHYYNPDRENLVAIGYEPTRDMETEIEGVLADLSVHQDRIVAHREALIPNIRWDLHHHTSSWLEDPVTK